MSSFSILVLSQGKKTCGDKSKYSGGFGRTLGSQCCRLPGATGSLSQGSSHEAPERLRNPYTISSQSPSAAVKPRRDDRVLPSTKHRVSWPRCIMGDSLSTQSGADGLLACIAWLPALRESSERVRNLHGWGWSSGEVSRRTFIRRGPWELTTVNVES